MAMDHMCSCACLRFVFNEFVAADCECTHSVQYEVYSKVFFWKLLKQESFSVGFGDVGEGIR